LTVDTLEEAIDIVNDNRCTNLSNLDWLSLTSFWQMEMDAPYSQQTQ